jgi:hypothetical protein
MRIKTLAMAAAAALLSSTALLHAQTFTFTTLDNPGDPTFNQLLGINDSGVIVGYFGSGTTGHPNIGYEIAPPYSKFTSNMQPGSVQTQAIAINNKGITTGFWSDTNTGTDANFAFIRQPVGAKFQYVSAIDPLVASTPLISQALGINNNNVVAGVYNDANGTPHAYTYNLGTAAVFPLDVGGHPAGATGINDLNQICGFFVNGSKTFGFVKSSNGGVNTTTSFIVPGTSFTQLLGINNAGVAVGFYMDANQIPHGIYYTPSTGAWLAVNDPEGVQGTVLNGINNKGELVGFYTDAAGNVHGMIVTVAQ